MEQADLKTVPGTHGLISTSEWTGVQFATLAREIGLEDGSAWVLAEGADAAVMTRSIPMEKMLKDALIVFGQNGEALRPEQGYPLRLVLPGYEGNTHIKWLRRMEVSDKPFMTREETSKYTDLLANGKARMYEPGDGGEVGHHVPLRRDETSGPGLLQHPGPGLDRSARGRVQWVDVSVDGGRLVIPLTSAPYPSASPRSRSPSRRCGPGRPPFCKAAHRCKPVRCSSPFKQLIAIRAVERSVRIDLHLNAIQSWAINEAGDVFQCSRLI